MDKFKNGFTVAITAILPVLSLPFYNYLISKNIPSIYSLILLMVISIIVAWIGYFIVPNLLYYSYFVRSIFDPLARYEGNWVHIIEVENQVDTRVCGIFTFSYNKFENKYNYSGNNYNINGELVSSFTCTDVQYADNGFCYYGKSKKDSRITTNSWGEINFRDTNEKKIYSANGFFVNNNNVLIRATYVSERITENVSLNHENERAIYAVKYYKEYKKSYNELTSV